MVDILVPSRLAPRYVYNRRELAGGGTPQRVRHVWCTNCKLKHGAKTELATEAGNIGTQALEYWSVKADGSWVKGKWWGNPYKCPTCGQEGIFGQDKPLMEEE